MSTIRKTAALRSLSVDQGRPQRQLQSTFARATWPPDKGTQRLPPSIHKHDFWFRYRYLGTDTTWSINITRMTEVMKHRALVFELRIKENWSHSSIVSANYQLFSGWVNRNLTGSIDHYGYRELWLGYGLAKKVGGLTFYRQSGEAARGPSKINQGYARLSIKISAKTNHRLWRTGE